MMRTLAACLVLVLGLAAGWFGRGWFIDQEAQAVQVRAEHRADSIAVLLDVAEDRVTEAQEAADSTARVAAEAVAAAEATVTPTRPPDPVRFDSAASDGTIVPYGAPETVAEAVSNTLEWVAYADSLAIVADRQRMALLSVQATNARLWTVNAELRGENELLRMQAESLREANEAIAQQLAVATRPPPWYRSDIAIGIYGAAAGAMVEGLLTRN